MINTACVPGSRPYQLHANPTENHTCCRGNSAGSDRLSCPHFQPTANRPYAAAPWHFLYFFPLPQGHGSFRPIVSVAGSAVCPNAPPPGAVAETTGARETGGVWAAAPPRKRSSVEGSEGGAGIRTGAACAPLHNSTAGAGIQWRGD